MTATRLLERLEGVRKTGDDRWIARCPSHEDKSPSLAIRELPDGAVLLHDFAGCSALEVVQSVGLELRDLFPERIGDHVPRKRRAFDPMDILRCCTHELQVAAIGAADLCKGLCSEELQQRLQLAADRLHSAWAVARGQ